MPRRAPAGIPRPTAAMGDFRPSLRELQRLFWRSLADAPGGGSPAPGLVELVAPRATLDVGARVGVYADAYFGRLRDVLREDFPHVAALLAARFDETARGYLRAHPSEDPSVRHLGRLFADFLEQRPDLPPYLSDLARLEWARIEVFDAPDARPLNAAALRGVAADDWPALRFVTIPALAVVRARWPVHELWAGADPAALAPAPTAVRVWRAAEFVVFHAPMDARADEALGRLMAGQPFAAACEAFADLPPADAAHEATALLLRWLEDGIIARLA